MSSGWDQSSRSLQSRWSEGKGGSGAERGHRQAPDRSCGGYGTKACVIADAARRYSSHEFRQQIRDLGAAPAIPTRSNEAPAACPDWTSLNRNRGVECSAFDRRAGSVFLSLKKSLGERILRAEWGWISLSSSIHPGIWPSAVLASGIGFTRRSSRLKVFTKASVLPLDCGLLTGVSRE